MTDRLPTEEAIKVAVKGVAGEAFFKGMEVQREADVDLLRDIAGKMKERGKTEVAIVLMEASNLMSEPLVKPGEATPYE